jgi:hypothetical protein
VTSRSERGVVALVHDFRVPSVRPRRAVGPGPTPAAPRGCGLASTAARPAGAWLVPGVVAPREGRVGLALPGMQDGGELPCTRGLGGREVPRFVGIVAQVVEFDAAAVLEELEELEIALTDRARRGRPADVAREVPEETLSLRPS